LKFAQKIPVSNSFCFRVRTSTSGFIKITTKKDNDFAVKLIKEHGVASVPLLVFYHKPNGQ